jgi:hypothetical protein
LERPSGERENGCGGKNTFIHSVRSGCILRSKLQIFRLCKHPSARNYC